MAKLQSLRGMVDLLPEQIGLWQRVEATAREHFARAGVAEIRTPVLETTELFARGIGEATDVVGKEMYTFSDRGERRSDALPREFSSSTKPCTPKSWSRSQAVAIASTSERAESYPSISRPIW